MGFTTMDQEILIKMSILIDGVDIDSSACEEVGTKYAENIAWVFVYNRDKLSEISNMPQDIVLPLGTCVEVRLSKKTPWKVRQVGDDKILEKNGKFVTTIDFTRRPEYYSMKTSDGVDMRTVATIKGRHGFDICNPIFCDCWTDDMSCKFCNMNPGGANYSSVALTKKSLKQIHETATAYREEVGHFHSVLTCGFPPKGKSSYTGTIDIIKTMKKATGFEKIRGITNIGPPDDFSEIDRLYEAGITASCIDIEIWDENIFNAICPGKVRRFGSQQYYIDACDYAAKVFGRGFSWSAMVVGIETRDTLLEGCKIMADKGTVMMILPWITNAYSKMEGHRAPEPEWYMDVLEEAHDIFDEYLPEVSSRDAYFADYFCPGCFDLCCHWDMVKKRNNITEKDGKLPENGISPWKGHQE